MKKENKSAVADIVTRLNEFTNIENIDKLNNVLLPKVEGFSKSLNDFTLRLKNMEIILVEFDRTISTKESKESIMLLKNEFY